MIRGGYDIIYSNAISAAFGDQNGAISAPAYANYFTYGQEGTDHTNQRPALPSSTKSGAQPEFTPHSVK